MNVQTSFGQPSERDLEIYAAVKIDCRRQVDVAAEYGLCQARVSQVVQAVRNWQLRSAPDDEMTGRAGPYVERQLDMRRLEWLYENTIQCYRRSCEPARRERSGENAQGEWSSTTTVHAAGNVQCLKLAGKLMELKWKLQDRERPLGPTDIMMSDLKTIQQWLIGERLRAQSEGRVPKEGHEVYEVVRQTLDELLGLEKGVPLSAEARRRLGRAAADYELAREGAGVTECESVGDAASPATSSPARSHARTPKLATEPTDTTDNISGPPLHDRHIEDCWPQDVKDYVMRGYKLAPQAAAGDEAAETETKKTADISQPAGSACRAGAAEHTGAGVTECEGVGEIARSHSPAPSHSHTPTLANGSSRQEEPTGRQKPAAASRAPHPEQHRLPALVHEIRLDARVRRLPKMAYHPAGISATDPSLQIVPQASGQ